MTVGIAAQARDQGAGDRVLLGHGAGGLLSNRLITGVLATRFQHPELSILDDAACVALPAGDLVMSTDGFVVDPPFFPGGDIGRLAITGTVNDVAMLGARPMYLSFGLLIEEGFPMEQLERIVDSAASTCEACGVSVITGDTKVLPSAAADGIFIHTTGVGQLLTQTRLSGRAARSGDQVLVSGTVGQHGAAIMALRNGIDLGCLESDCAPLAGLVERLLQGLPAGSVHTLRDPTRGGLASVLNEIADSAGVEVELDEARVPLSDEAQAVCEILGLDPLYLASEGRLVAVVDGAVAQSALELMQEHPLGADAALIGAVRSGERARVIVRTPVDGYRTLDLLAGEALPRIC